MLVEKQSYNLSRSALPLALLMVSPLGCTDGTGTDAAGTSGVGGESGEAPNSGSGSESAGNDGDGDGDGETAGDGDGDGDTAGDGDGDGETSFLFETLPFARVTIDGELFFADRLGYLRISAPPEELSAIVEAPGHSLALVKFELHGVAAAHRVIKLLPHGPVEDLNIDIGGTVTIGDVSLTLQAGSLENSDGVLATGSVQVSLPHFDPTEMDFNTLPAPLAGKTDVDDEIPIQSLGMVELVVTQDGEPLFLREELPAELAIVVPEPLLVDNFEGDFVPDWWLDSAEEIWSEEGPPGELQMIDGTLTWVAEVEQLGWHNSDHPVTVADFECYVLVLEDEEGEAISRTFRATGIGRGVFMDSGFSAANLEGTNLGSNCVEAPLGAAVELSVEAPLEFVVEPFAPMGVPGQCFEAGLPTEGGQCQIVHAVVSLPEPALCELGQVEACPSMGPDDPETMGLCMAGISYCLESGEWSGCGNEWTATAPICEPLFEGLDANCDGHPDPVCELWCEDSDGDGSGNPDECVSVDLGDPPPMGYVEGGSDCLDSDANVFLGAAELDDPSACMLDADMDGWGDDQPPPGVVPGRDCDDADMNAVCVEAASSCIDATQDMEVQLMATAIGGEGSYIFDWTPLETLDDPTVANPVAMPSTLTTYTVTASDGLMNLGSDQVTVHLDEPWSFNNQCVAVDFGDQPTGHSISQDGTQVCTTTDTKPTAYICPTVHERVHITGSLTVTDDDGDNDVIGFVWGWQNSDQFYLFSWKKTYQPFFFGCSFDDAPKEGMTVKKVDAQDNLTVEDLACSTGTSNVEILRSPMEIGALGWVEGVEYGVDLNYDLTKTEITITDNTNDVEIANFTVNNDSYPSGQFGSYSLSQINACNGPWRSTCL